MRVACLMIPDLPVHALRRHDPTLGGAPIVVGGVPPERGHVTALCPEARQLGLRLGMTLAQAQSIAPGARFLPPDPDLVRREEQALVTQLGELTPGIERAACPEGVWFLDLRGLGRLYTDEVTFARTARASARRRDYPAAVGVGSNKLIAEIAARKANGGIQVVAPGSERDYLAPLPLHFLPFEPVLLERLRGIGLVTISDWAALPAATVAARFGATGLRLHTLALGTDDAPFQPLAPPDELAVEVDLPGPLDDVALLTFHLKRAVEKLCGRLVSRGLSTTSVGITLNLDNHGRATLEASFPRPTLAPRLVLDCLRLVIARETLPAPVVGFTIMATAVTRAPTEQLDLFLKKRAAGDPGVMEQALARIRAMLGPDSVVSPRPADTHRPEQQVEWIPYVAEAKTAFGRDRPRPPVLGPLPARLLADPVAAEVRVATSGRPTFLAVEFTHGPVVEADGPHRVHGEWWGESYQRDYYIVTLPDGGRYWIFRDRIEHGFYLHGYYD